MGLGVIFYVVWRAVGSAAVLGASALFVFVGDGQSSDGMVSLGLGVFTKRMGLLVQLWRWFVHARRTGDWTLPEGMD